MSERRNKAPPPPPPCEARGDGQPCEYEENERCAELVCKYCGRVGERVFSSAQAKVFDPSDEKKLCADRGRSLGPLGTTFGAVYTSNTSSLAYGMGPRAPLAADFRKKRVCSTHTAATPHARTGADGQALLRKNRWARQRRSRRR